ncbi:hypothetical protein HK099_004957 [Clydaea vesicula]|uniref:Uncharacterized protein n=1 Tax=Clydaea vesicula TaxID=447962 RepID=A0AAD5XV99_9FUNG|nr:hypothetical protein HK099_004957 [Clydaea vesicula]
MQKIAQANQIPIMQFNDASLDGVNNNNNMIFRNLINVLASKNFLAIVRFGEQNPVEGSQKLQNFQGLVLVAQQSRLFAFCFIKTPLTIFETGGVNNISPNPLHNVGMGNLSHQQQQLLQQQLLAQNLANNNRLLNFSNLSPQQQQQLTQNSLNNM